MNTSIKRSQGFTIVELMIATAVFGVVTLLCAVGIMQIGRMFYKGVTTVRTQEVTRSVADEIIQQLKFSSDDITTFSGAGIDVLCIGGLHYIYQIDKEVKTSPPTQHALERVRLSGDAPCDNNPPASAQRVELLGENMRIAKPNGGSGFDIRCDDNGLCSLKIVIAYGDDDVFVDDNHSQCRGGPTGSQFCGVSAVNTFVTKRVN